MQLWAPAKINLSFKILGRRPDGFHEIDTLMAPISLRDRLTFAYEKAPASVVEFECDDPTLPGDGDNLVVRAAELFLKAARVNARVTITLEKQIPHGAGLGGGSSDAATTLLGLNELLDVNLSLAELIAVAAEIGSDVPFFLLRSSARCRGRGEIVSSAKVPRAFRLLLVKPDFGVPTPAAYARWQNSRELTGIDYTVQQFAGMEFCNDLEQPVFEKYVFLAEIKHWLRGQAEVAVALLSGSGSTLFAVLHDHGDANALAERIRAELDPKLWTCAAATVDR